MNKNTFYAIFLSIIIITGSFYVQTRFFPPQLENTSASQSISAEDAPFIQAVNNEEGGSQAYNQKSITVTTDTFRAVLSSKNAVVTSLIKKCIINDKEELVELLPQTAETDRDEAFRVLLGSEYLDAGQSKAFTSGKLHDVIFSVSQPHAHTVVFRKDFATRGGQIFTLTKTYLFKNGEDVFELYVSIKNKNNEVLNLGDAAYTLTFGPQLGPSSEVHADKKNNRTNERLFVGLLGNKLKTIRLKRGRASVQNTQYKWSGIAGRYFSLLVFTNTAHYTTTFSANQAEGLSSGAQLAYTRSPLQSSAIEDVFRIYAGGISSAHPARYNSSDQNSFQISNAEFNKIKPRRLLSFLEQIFAWMLTFIYKLIPNYGIAIIILTLLMRAATLPILSKSKENGEKMKALGPKIQQIRERFPDDRARQSQEMLELYRREQFSPFSSFLPMLIQIPLFLTMYRVIYESSSLWRQPFIGWIRDLSESDMFLSFGDFTLPFLNWKGLNILPIVMLGTQFLSSWILTKQQKTSASATGSQGMMLFLSYGFPFIIFFALYNSPSGLILYWIVSNLFTVFSMINTRKPAASTTNLEGSQKELTKKETKKKTFAQRLQAYAHAHRKALAKNSRRKK